MESLYTLNHNGNFILYFLYNHVYFFSKYTNTFPKNKLTQNIIRESDLKNDF